MEDITKEETLEAIRGSIRKWSLIVHLEGADKGVYNCPLCDLFNNEEDGCQGCPIRTHTKGDNFCESTPYARWYAHCQDKHPKGSIFRDYHRIQCPECRKLAQEELMFLQGVLKRYKEEV